MKRERIDYDTIALTSLAMWEQGHLAAEVKVGRYIVGALFNGDYSKVRGADAHLQKIAARGSMKIGAIRRAVRIARLAHEWPDLVRLPGVGVNHVAMVLAQPVDVARAELEKASRNGWSLREFRSRNSIPRRSGRPGRPRVPEPLKAARAMAKFATRATMWENLGDLSPADRESMMAALERVEARLQAAMVELAEMEQAHRVLAVVA